MQAAAPERDDIVLLRDQSWDDWLRLVQARGDRSVPQLAYLDGTIELMAPSRHHERLKSFIGRLLETWALEVGVELVPLGSWTLHAPAGLAGAEPDECYQVGTIERDRPDLAIEVVWTHRRLDKLEIYRRLGVGEVWVWDRGALQVHVLQDSAYVPSPRSRMFPALDLALLGSLLDRPTLGAAQRALLAALRGRETS
jgi:Uma2 family endonuclease